MYQLTRSLNKMLYFIQLNSQNGFSGKQIVYLKKFDFSSLKNHVLESFGSTTKSTQF